MNSLNRVDEDIKNKGGRPNKCHTDDLNKVLYNYIQEKNLPRIKEADLIKYSGIPIQAWRFNKEIKKVNKRIEDMSLVSSTEEVNELINIPSPEDLVNTNYKNKYKLIKVVSDLIDLYVFNFNKALKTAEVEKENEKHKKRIEALESDIEFYKEEMKVMVIDSRSVLEREKDGIKESVLDIKNIVRRVRNLKICLKTK